MQTALIFENNDKAQLCHVDYVLHEFYFLKEYLADLYNSFII